MGKDGHNNNSHKSNNRNNEWGKGKIKSVTDSNGAKRHCPDSSSNESDLSLTNLSSILNNIERSGNMEQMKKAVDIIFDNKSIKACLLECFQSKLTQMDNEIQDLKNRLDDMEQYSRRNCLKITGIKEHEGENTDQAVLNVINDIIFKDAQVQLSMSSIERSHRVGPQRGKNHRDIIVKFQSYRDRHLVFTNKRNLKSYNRNPSNNSRIYINEALTRHRSKLFAAVRRLAKNKTIENAWTADGCIKAKLLDKTIVSITRESDIDRFIPGASDVLHNFLDNAASAKTSTPFSRF